MAYTNAIFYVDHVLGNDAARADLIPSAYANNGSGLVRVTVGSLGAVPIVTGAIVTIAGTTGSVYAAVWAVTVINSTTIDLIGSVYSINPAAKGTCIPRGGDSWANAWKTLTTGASAARVAPGDAIRCAKSPDPSLLGNARWTTTTRVGGYLDSTVSITSSTNGTPIRITKTAHGLITGDAVQVKGHTTNTNANGVWLITKYDNNSFDLDGSVGNGIGGASGTFQLITPYCIILENAVTRTITNCEANWTPGTNVTSANIEAGSYSMQHLSSLKVVTGASCGANQIIAKYALPVALNLSGYEQISFWFKNNTTATTAGQLEIRLYNDGACTSLAETFAIPAAQIPYYMNPFTINKGSALSNNIQGIAIYATVALASKTYYFDNIIACKAVGSADSLSLTSLISKSSAATGGQWYALQSIDDKIVILASSAGILPFGLNSKGYIGTSDSSIATYKRETIKMPMASSSNADTEILNVAGTTLANRVLYEGGYNTSNSVKDGETYLDGQCMFGLGMRISNKSYMIVSGFSFVRYYNGVDFNYTFHDIQISNLINCSNYGANLSSLGMGTVSIVNAVQNTTAVIFSSCYNLEITSLGYLDMNKNYGFNPVASVFLNIQEIKSASNNNTGCYIQNCIDIVVHEMIMSKCNYSCAVSTSTGARILFNKLETTLNLQNCGCIGGGDLTLRNMLATESLAITTNPNQNDLIYLHNYNRAGNLHYIFSDGVSVFSDSTTRHTASGYSWAVTITAANRTTNYPFRLPVAKVAVNANALVTVKLWFKLSHATQIGAWLAVRKNQLGGVDDAYTACAENTNWQELTLTFLPTEAGVIEIEALCFYRSFSPGTIYIDDITITQA